MKTILFIFIASCAIGNARAEMDHSTFNTLLKTHVSSIGKVNYKKFKTDETKLDAYLELLSKNVPASAASSNEKKAFWANAYNAFTIKLILKNFPVKSIKDIKVGGKDAWSHDWIKIGTETLSLNDIENKKLREAFKDARIHFVINCASKSCPTIANKAFTSTTIEAALTQMTKAFINNTTHNTLTESSVQICEFFKWYEADFKQGGITVIDFLNKYSKVKIKSDAKITYKTYDWSLNN